MSEKKYLERKAQAAHIIKEQYILISSVFDEATNYFNSSKMLDSMKIIHTVNIDSELSKADRSIYTFNHRLFLYLKMALVHFCGYNFKIPKLKKSQNLKKYFGGDIQKFSQNLRVFIWANIKEKNIYLHTTILGQVLVLTFRLDENNIPKPGEEPINAIDQLAYIHDLAYQKSDNISDRHEADIQMINGLKQLKNLSIPQKLIRAMIIKLFQAKI